MLKIAYPGTPLTVSYHNHSNLSDGGSSLEEMCRTGKRTGLKEFGISDHWVIPPEEGTDADEWRMDPARLEEYVEKVMQLKKELDDGSFTLRLGMEVDFFYENVDEVLLQLKKYPFDYLIGSVHYAGTFPIDHDVSDWENLTEKEKDEVCNIYWHKMLGAASRKEFTFLGHLDLPKKFGCIRNEKYLPLAEKVLDLVQKNGLAIELNTAGYFKPCAAPYPCPEILKEANLRKIPVVITSDAHSAAHITRNFAEAAELLKSAGYRYL